MVSIVFRFWCKATSIPKQQQDPPPSNPLTNQELHTLELLAKGLTNAQIAGRLHLSRHTIKSYVERIIAMLEVSDRTQAAVRAVTLELITDPINS